MQNFLCSTPYYTKNAENYFPFTEHSDVVVSTFAPVLKVLGSNPEMRNA
jgi:hypothetical protein